MKKREEEFKNFSVERTYGELKEKSFFYLKKLKTFLKIIEKNKEKNKEKMIYIKEFKPLKINLENKNDQKDVDEISDYMKNIIEFSEKKNY